MVPRDAQRAAEGRMARRQDHPEEHPDGSGCFSGDRRGDLDLRRCGDQRRAFPDRPVPEEPRGRD